MRLEPLDARNRPNSGLLEPSSHRNQRLKKKCKTLEGQNQAIETWGGKIAQL
jgi:hypothetical protein